TNSWTPWDGVDATLPADQRKQPHRLRTTAVGAALAMVLWPAQRRAGTAELPSSVGLLLPPNGQKARTIGSHDDRWRYVVVYSVRSPAWCSRGSILLHKVGRRGSMSPPSCPSPWAW